MEDNVYLRAYNKGLHQLRQNSKYKFRNVRVDAAERINLQRILHKLPET